MKLKGSTDIYRLRKKNYRIIFKDAIPTKSPQILRIMRRDEKTYENLKDLL